MTSDFPSDVEVSTVKDVEDAASDHSSALKLLNLGKPRTPMQEPSLKLENGEGERIHNASTLTMEPQLQHHSPPTTHGRNRKKRRMLDAQAAASTILKENQITESSRNGVKDTSEGKNGIKKLTSYTEAAISSSDFAVKDETKDSSPEPSSSPDLPVSGTVNKNNDCGSVIHDKRNFGSTTTKQEGESSLEPKKTGHQRRTGPRRHASLPNNRQKQNETNEDTRDPDVEYTEIVEKVNKGMGKKDKSSTKKIATSPEKYVDNPTDKDILLGRYASRHHPGNEVYRQTVRKLKSQTKEIDKAKIAREIVDHIYNSGARFLKMNNSNRWEVVPDIDVMTKVGKAIKELRGNLGSVNNEKAPKSSGRMKKVGKAILKLKGNSGSMNNEKTPKSSGSASVLESLNEKETSTRRPKRKATLGLKVNDFMAETAPPSNRQQKKRKRAEKQKDGEGSAPTRRQRIVEVEKTFEEYTYKPDPSEYYIEETAHIYHNPPFPSIFTNGVKIEDLRPVPPPTPLPSFPVNDTCQWSYHESDRVVIADFSVGKNERKPLVTLEDSKFLFEMQERTDITVIARGLLNMSKIDPSMWNLEYLRKCVGREFYHKFRRFDKIVDENGMEAYTEKDNLFSMRFADYVEYCEKRELFIAKGSASFDAEEPIFTFEDHLGKIHSVGVGTSALYMIDLDMKRLTPLLNNNFLESFELPSVLPGGSHCMMNSVTPDARPFMGPNLYVTPPASFTHFHQDGHGTVDSGHLCISGFNEVVMLRRLTERHKKHALWILSGKKPGGFHFDGLYSMPHGDGLGKKPSWPNMNMIEECRNMGYCPSVFTLEPGDLVHINKGRLHAFRKMSTTKLPEWDCHVQRRQTIIQSKDIAGEEKLCVSVAWDWMYRGVTSEGINREVCTVLEASALNRRNEVTSLAIPELSLLQMAKSIPARVLTPKKGISFLGALEKEKNRTSVYDSTKAEICKGIYPALCVVVGQHVRALNVKESKSRQKGERLSIAKIPDTQENPQACPLDPYGNSDFQCKLCSKELSNVYFHCDGCEKLLSKDFNICRGCYLQGKFEIKVQMHPSNPKRHATLNHMGDNKFDRESRCPCKNGPACNHCGYCLGCSCRCHTWFTMRTRLCNAADEEKLLQTVKDTAIIKSAIASDGVPTAGTSEIDEPTKHLYDRLKDAGDEELLNEEEKEKVNEDENGNAQLSNEQMKDQTIPNGDERPPNGIKKEITSEDKNREDVVKSNKDSLIKKKDEDDNCEVINGGNSKSFRLTLNQIEDDDCILI